jgi:alpha-N-arabinofuranosidase
MEMFNIHQEATMIPLPIKSNDYSVGGENLPAVTGSASKNSSGFIHISLTNIDAHQQQEITIDLKGLQYSTVTGRIISSGKLQEFNSFEKPDLIIPIPFKSFTSKQNKLVVKLPALSVVVLEVK